jgi:hypothetical protein
MLQEPVIRRVTLSRYLFELAIQNARSDQDVAGAACVNLLQDAVEIFLLAALDHLNVGVSAKKTDFPQYLDKINEAIADELPFRRRLLEINKVRVLSKHEGIPPNRKEIEGYVSDARSFLEHACHKILAVDFWTVSLTRLLEDGESKSLLLEAEATFEKGDYRDCLIACRKAFYVEFESSYDIQKDLMFGFGLFGSRAPYYARNKEYIEKNVATPFDYIVLDHSQVDADLTKEGLDHTAFWNIWRLTPEVYRHKNEDKWLVKHDPNKLVEDGIKERAAYVLESIVAILLARQGNRKKTKMTSMDRSFAARLRRPHTTVYKKADRNGEVEGITKEGLQEILLYYATPGLKDEGTYWRVAHLEREDPLGAPHFLSGYVREEDLDFG